MTRPTPEINAYLDGDPTPEETRALEAWIQADQANAHAFLAAVRLHQQIGTQLRKDRFDQALTSPSQPATTKDGDAAIQALASLVEMEAAAEPLPFETIAGPHAFDSQQNRSTRNEVSLIQALDDLRWVTGKAAARLIRSPQVLTTAAAAILLLALILINPFTNNTPAPPQTADNTLEPNKPAASTPSTPRGSERHAVATLTVTHNAQWAQAEGASAPGSHVRTGDTLAAGQRLNLTHGFAEITTNRGAIALIQAPATIQFINNDNALYLHTGKLVGICETDSSKGFAIQTDYCTVVDIGTEFGVSVLPTGVEATVFVGEIAVKTPNEPTTVITHNQTARLSIGRDGTTLVVEDKLAQGYTRWQPRPAVITSAKISDERFSLEIAPQGIYEDALIYSDRDYQINGLDAEGLPKALLNGELIRMPADARTGRTADIGKIRVEIELSERCDIYLIAAPNQRALDWVKRDYELTSMRIGLDTSDSFVREQNPVGLGVGPGQSIDETYHVWKRKQPATGRITFGPAHDQSMYSIVAIPMDNDAN